MNYLAHIYLSGSNRQVQVGNFIGDFVKGCSYENYPEDIKRGILHHRFIDNLADTHPAFIETVDLLRPSFGRYSGIMADMYFDYFLASGFKEYNPSCSLRRFSYNFYLSALLNYRWLPRRVKGFIFHFIGTNRLVKYATTEGLRESLQIMSHYKSNAIKPQLGISFLKENEELLKKLFESFMTEAIEHFRQ